MYERYIKLVVGHPLVVLLLTAAITAAFATQLDKLYSDARAESFIPPHDDALHNLHLVEKLFGTTYITRIMILRHDHPDGIYNTETLALIAEITQWLEAQAEFETAMNADLRSLSTVNNILGDEFGMVVRPFMEEAPTTRDGALELRAALEANPMYKNLLVSADGKGASIMVRESAAGRADRPAVYFKLRGFLDGLNARGYAEELHITGRTVIEGLFGIYISTEGRRMLPFVLAFLALFLFLSFRSLRAVLLPLAVVAATEIWMLGFLGAWGHPMYPVTSILPVLIVAIAVADSIHLLAKYYEARLQLPHADVKELVAVTMREMGPPVFMTSITTAVGFLSMTSSPLIPLFDFAIVMAFGIGAAFVLTLAIIPGVLVLLPARGARWNPRESVGPSDGGLLTKLLASAATLSSRRPHTVLTLAVLFTACGVGGLTQLTSDSSMAGQFPPHHHLRLADEIANQHFAGGTTLELIIDTGDKDGVKDPELLQGMDDFQAGMEEMALVGDTFSLAELVKKMNRVMNGDRPDAERIPDSRELVAQYLLLYSMSGDPGDFDDLVDYDYRRAHLTVFIKDSSTKWARRVTEKARTLLDETLKPGSGRTVDVRFAGRAYTNTRLEGYVNSSQISTIFIAAPALVLICWLMFGRLALGLLAVTPVAIAIVGIYGAMGYISLPTDIATSLLGGMALGIGIDFAIHYLHKYMSCRRRGMEADDAAALTAVTAGRALFFNATVLVGGFIVLLGARFYPQMKLGALVSVTMVICYLATMYIFPAALRSIKLR